jgi:hypothetical protein
MLELYAKLLLPALALGNAVLLCWAISRLVRLRQRETMISIVCDVWEYPCRSVQAREQQIWVAIPFRDGERELVLQLDDLCSAEEELWRHYSILHELVRVPCKQGRPIVRNNSHLRSIRGGKA